MNVVDWQKKPELALELDRALKQPIIVQALEILKELNMANTLCGASFIPAAASGQALFGYDAGRASIFHDLKMLSAPIKEKKTLKPSYRPLGDDSSKTPTKEK